MKYNVLFLHGFFSSGNCDFGKALKNCLTDELRSYDDMYATDEVDVLSPDLPLDPNSALEFIRKKVEENNIDVIVGNNSGAMFAQIIASEYKLPCLVGSPLYKMSRFLEERKGTHQYKTEREDVHQTLVIDDNLIDAYAKVEANNLVPKDKAGNSAPEAVVTCKPFVWGIFGENDKLATIFEDGVEKNTQEREFLKYYSLSFHFPGGDTPTYEETRKFHVPLVARLIMEFAYYRKKQKEGESDKDKKYRLGVEYTHEFSQFYIDKMKELYEEKGFFRCDIDGDFSHIIYRYRPNGKDKPYYEKDGIKYDFLIEYHRGKPSEGIYYGCRAKINKDDNLESRAKELRNQWPNIFLQGYERSNHLQRELTKILNNTFQWKDFFKCYKPTDNIWEQRYWLFWVTLCDDEDIRDVGAVAIKLMARTFMRDNEKQEEPVEKKRGRKIKNVEKRKSTLKRQYTHYTVAAYERLVSQLGKDLESGKPSYFCHDEESVNNLIKGLVSSGWLSRNDNYEKGWFLNYQENLLKGKKSKENLKDAFKDEIKEILTKCAEEKFKTSKLNCKYSYPGCFDLIIMHEDETPIDDQR